MGGRPEMMRRLYFQRQRDEVKDERWDRELVKLVLDHAKQVIAHPSRPTYHRLENYLRSPFGELAIEESLEEDPFLEQPEALLVEVSEEKPFTCVAMLDMSSSMSGEKHLLASIAVAVLLLEVASEDSALTTFASDAREIKRLGVEEPVETTILRFLKHHPRGFTNIARGLEMGMKEFSRGRFPQGRRKVGLLVSDGRATEGGDPIEVARQFDFLLVLHLHGPGSHIEGSREMASEGNGICLEVERFEELPRRLYEAVRMLGRL